MLLGQHAKATSRSRSRQAPAGWQGKQDPVEKHPREGSTKVMTFLQPQPEGSKYLFFIKKIIPSPVEKLSLVRFGNIKKISQLVLEISKNYPKYELELSEIIPCMC